MFGVLFHLIIYIITSLDLWYRILYLHNVISIEVYTCCNMLLKPRGIDIYTSGKSLQYIFIFKHWQIGCLYDYVLVYENVN